MPLLSDGLYFPNFDEIKWPLPLPGSNGQGNSTNQDYINMLLFLIKQLKQENIMYQQYIDDLLQQVYQINTWVEYQSGMVSGVGGVDCFFKCSYINKPAYYIQPVATGEYIVNEQGYIGIHINGSPGVEYSLVAYMLV